VVFVYYQPALRDSPDLWKITGYMDFIRYYRIADFVQRWLALQIVPDLFRFIRSGGLCAIVIGLEKITFIMLRGLRSKFRLLYSELFVSFQRDLYGNCIVIYGVGMF
jgi:hypothetical protein